MQVFVENPNTIVIDVDQGRQGRGIQNITYTEVSGQYFLIVTYTDGTTETLGPLVITGGAAFLLGGTTGSIPYQNAPNTTVFLPIGTQNQVVVAGATAPQYTSALTGLTVNNSAIGNTAPSTGAFTNLSASGTFALTGDQVQISEGGTGQTTANGAFNALAPSQTGNAGKYLKTNGTNTSWDQLDISTADITGVLPVVNGGTGASTASGARANLSAAVLGANNDITSMTGVTGGISSPDFVQFDTAATNTNAVGKVYWDASQGTLDLGLLGGNVVSRIGQSLVAYVTNAEAVTITKGQAVYLFSAQGDRATVKLAYNTSDTTSAKTLGIVAENIAAGQTGFVMCQGVLDGLNLAAFNPGDTLYLGPTPGSLTATKPSAPNHLVYIGVVERSNVGNGQLYIRVQNGYELEEIHDVQIVNPQNGQTIIYDATTSLWKNANLTAGTGVSVTNGPASVTIGNTGVLSFSGGTTGLTPATSTTGAVTLGGTLATTNGGTGLTSFTANRVFYASSTSAIGQSANLTFDGTTLTANNFTDSSLTSGRVTYATTGGNLTDSANLLFDGTTLTANALTTTSTVTINGGTANGVAYLNGSKVLTTGSALTFDGTKLNAASSADAAVALFGVSNATTGGGSTLNIAAASNQYAFPSVRGDTVLRSESNSLVFGTASEFKWGSIGAEWMRLTSTGLGIGTSSPTNKLTVDGNANITGNTTLGDSSTDTVTVNGYMGVGGAGLSNIAVYARSTALTGAGQVGVQSQITGSSSATSGVYAFLSAPKTEASVFTAAAVYGFHAIDATKGAGSTITNLHGVYIADQTQGTNNYGITSLVSSGTNKWNIYASGTAANYFAGNVGIGTSSPNARLHVSNSSNGASVDVICANTYYGASSTDEYASFQGEFYQNDVSANRAAGYVRFGKSGDFASNANASAYLAFATRNAGTLSEKMRIDSAGNVGIGTSSPLGKLHVETQPSGAGITPSLNGDELVLENNSNCGLTIGTENLASIFFGKAADSDIGGIGYAMSDNSMRFTTNASERLRIDSAGNVGIGTSSPATKLDVKQSGANWYDGIRVVRSTNDNQRLVLGNTSGASFIASVDASGGANNDLLFGTSTNGTTFSERARITSAGDFIQTANTTAPTLSTNGTVGIQRVSDTELKILMRGSDGVTRSVTLTLA